MATGACDVVLCPLMSLMRLLSSMDGVSSAVLAASGLSGVSLMHLMPLMPLVAFMSSMALMPDAFNGADASDDVGVSDVVDGVVDAVRVFGVGDVSDAWWCL